MDQRSFIEKQFAKAKQEQMTNTMSESGVNQHSTTGVASNLEVILSDIEKETDNDTSIPSNNPSQRDFITSKFQKASHDSKNSVTIPCQVSEIEEDHLKTEKTDK